MFAVREPEVMISVSGIVVVDPRPTLAISTEKITQ